MLSNAQRDLIKATVPLLESGGEALTTHFYRMMLSEFPEVRPLFNQAHQASGDQPRALANGVLMYAKHIDRLEALGPLVAQIVNIACGVAQRNIATPADIDKGVKLGLGYPFGPLEWAERLGAGRILFILERLQAFYGEPRYRPGPWLKRRVALGLPLSAPEGRDAGG